MTVWVSGRVRRPSGWDAVLLGILHSWASPLLLALTRFPWRFKFNHVLSTVSVLVKSCTSGSLKQEIVLSNKEKKITCLASLFPPPSCGRAVWLARASSHPDSLRKLGCFQSRVQKWKLPGLPLKNKKQKTFYSTCNFETISDLQKHCRNSTNESVYLSPRFPTPYIITVLVLWAARILDWEVSEHCFQHSSYWSKQPQVCVSGMDSGGGELDFTLWWASGKATCQMAFGLGDLWKHCHKSPWW